MKKIAVTGATGFLGKYICQELISKGYQVKAWYRTEKPKIDNIEWIQGELGSETANKNLVESCDSIVHAAVFQEGKSFMEPVKNIEEYIRKNLIGSLQLIEEAKKNKINKFIFISSCAVYNEVLEDRPFDENHPQITYSHYGAYKASIEKFIQSYAKEGFNICSLRPTAIYGSLVNTSSHRWHKVIESIKNNKDIQAVKGRKYVHATDVAKATRLLLESKNTFGESYNCYDMYIDEYLVASIAKKHISSTSKIIGAQTTPKHQILTNKIENLGMKFGGSKLLEETIKEFIHTI